MQEVELPTDLFVSSVFKNSKPQNEVSNMSDSKNNLIGHSLLMLNECQALNFNQVLHRHQTHFVFSISKC